MSWQEFRQIVRHSFAKREDAPQSASSPKIDEPSDFDFGDTVPCAHWQQPIEDEAVTFH